MIRVLCCLVLLGSLLYSAPPKRKPAKGADVEVAAISARRSGADVVIDGKLKNCGEKTHAGVVLLFDFLTTGNQVVATKKAPLDAEALAPGEEAEFHVRVADPVRAMWIRVNAADHQDRELKVANHGPFTIE